MKKILILCLLISVPGLIKAQEIIKGYVLSADNHKPVPNATIVITTLHLRTHTDSNGAFLIKNMPAQMLCIVITSVGYKEYVDYITPGAYGTSPGRSSDDLTILLKPATLQIGEVEVEAKVAWRGSIYLGYPNEYVITKADMRSSGAITLTDGLTKIPGIGALSTGPGISKPVIRGMYGNRIQTIYCGMRFDNQQWQDEHGLGLNDVGVDRIDVILGPASLKFGSEALGGVIRIVNEKPAPLGYMETDANVKFFSNTLGTALEYGAKYTFYNKEGSDQVKSWHIRAAAESHADYSDGGNTRVLNTRFNGSTLKAGLNWKRKNHESSLDYTGSYYNFGFVTVDNIDRLVADARYSMLTNQPHHTVIFNILSWQNTWRISQNNFLLFNLGYHANNRLEAEAGDKISLNMFLNTLSYDLHYIKNYGHSYYNSTFIIGSQGMAQTNTNLGSRIIIPDASIGEASVFAELNHYLRDLQFNAGLRYDFRDIKTLNTDGINYDAHIQPFNKIWNVFNGSVGLNLEILKLLHIYADANTGFRSPNLAELSSNGLHEGTYRWEIGNPDMKAEQNIGTDMGMIITSEWISLKLGAYKNHIYNFIYLSPSKDTVHGFQVFNYRQDNATLQGGEAGLEIHPGIKWIEIYTTFNRTNAQRDDGTFLPYIPAKRVRTELSINNRKLGKISNVYFKAGFEYVYAQNNIAEFETTTPAYHLLSAGFGGQFMIGNHKATLSINGNNILNAKYVDNLSRLKPIGFYDIGRNIMLNFNVSLSKLKSTI